MFKWLYRHSELPVLLVGEGGSGKTTFLSQLIHNQAVYAIPTMGHYLTPIKYKRRAFSIWDTGMGCFRYSNWLQYFYTPETCVLFFHDCTWNEEMTELNIDLLSRIGTEMLDLGYRSIWVLFNKQDSRPGQDIEYLWKLYTEKLRAIFNDPVNCKVIYHPLSTKTGEGITVVMDDLLAFMTGTETRKLREPYPRHGHGISQKQQASQQAPKETDLKAQIEEEGSKDMIDAQQFWRTFLNADLLEWDHRSHLKSGYIIVLESFKKGDNIFDMAETFLGHLRRLKEMKPDSFRNTEHRTMTIFWLVQLQQAIVKYKVHTNEGQFPSWDDFQHVLLDTPALMNTSLWTQYYTKGHMFSTSARQSWVLPDRQPLPGLSSPTQGSLSMQSNDPDRLLRYAFEVVQHTLKTASRRGHIVKEALDSVQATTIRLRRTNSSIPPYSETQVYFWIQVVHAAIQSFEAATEDSPNENSILDIPASRLSSASFSALFNTNSSLWRQYYSEKIWNGIAARMEFVLPDLKPLPSVINPSSRSHEQSALFKQMESALLRHGPELPTVEYLSLRATWIIRGADELAASSVADSPRISSHSHLLLYLYRKLLLESQGKTLRDIALDQVEGISGPSVNSITHKTFWVQVFLTAISRVGCWQETSQDQSPKVVTFEALVRRNLQLVFEDLPGLYYTREIWSSHEASEVMIAPDRRNMPGMHCADSHELDNLFFF